MLLPQGQFATFLKCQPADRRDMLNNLFRLQVYERMRARAAEREKLHGNGKAERENRLSQDFEDVTPEAVTRLAGRRDDLQQQKEKAEQQAAETRQRWQAAQRDCERSQELAAKQLELRQREEKTAAIEAAAARVQAAQRAAGIVPLLNQTEVARLRQHDQTQALEQSAAALATRRQDLDHAKQVADAARQAAAVIPKLREQVIQLTEAATLVERRDSLLGQIGEQETALEKLGETQRDLDAEMARVSEKKATVAGQLASAIQARADVGYDPDLDRRLESVRDRANQLQSDRARLLGEANQIRVLVEEANGADASLRSVTLGSNGHHRQAAGRGATQSSTC